MMLVVRLVRSCLGSLLFSRDLIALLRLTLVSALISVFDQGVTLVGTDISNLKALAIAFLKAVSMSDLLYTSY